MRINNTPVTDLVIQDSTHGDSKKASARPSRPYVLLLSCPFSKATYGNKKWTYSLKLSFFLYFLHFRALPNWARLDHGLRNIQWCGHGDQFPLLGWAIN